MELSLYDIYRDLKMKKIIFCYSGPIAQSSIEGIGSTLRRNLAMDDAGHGTVLSVFSIFIEQVQNVLNYSAERLGTQKDQEQEQRIGVVVIGREENDDYVIYCGNQVYNVDIPRMQDQIELVIKLDKDQLKTLYKERRKMAAPPGNKGAGLGLIEMARKSGQPLEYVFIPIDEMVSFFSIKVVVGRSRDGVVAD